MELGNPLTGCVAGKIVELNGESREKHLWLAEIDSMSDLYMARLKLWLGAVLSSIKWKICRPTFLKEDDQKARKAALSVDTWMLLQIRAFRLKMPMCFRVYPPVN